MDEFTRGATVSFSIVFRDAADAITTPSDASVFLSFFSTARVRTTVEIDLTESAGAWVATWDSRVAAEGVVQAHVRTDTPLPLSASDFTFSLEANLANPAS